MAALKSYNTLTGQWEVIAVGYTGSIGFTGSAGTAGGAGERGYTGSVGAGYTGSKGDTGSGLNIVGYVGSSAGLPYPYNGNIGDGYLTADNGHLHVWMNPNWLDVGQIRGYTGSAGTGFSGSGGGGGGGGSGGSPNLDGGTPNTIYGGISPIDGGGVVL